MKTPELSVVISCFNEAAALPAALDNVFAQTDCDLEVIVVNDGSTDATGRILAEYAQRDRRLRPMEQTNRGLTRALVAGCSQARGAYIARQDAGDASLPGRMAAQLRLLRESPGCVAATCHTRFVGPAGELLYTCAPSEDAVNLGLAACGPDLCGPSHHGSVMMRADAYRRAGGYREAFYYAQDLDLWTRLAGLGRFGVVDAVLYQAALAPGSISGTRSAEQRRLAAIIGQLVQARSQGRSEEEWLAQARSVVPGKHSRADARLAQGNYFIGSCVRRAASGDARPYFEQAVRHNRLHLRAWLRLLQTRAGL